MTLNELLELKYTDAEKYELALDEYMEDKVAHVYTCNECKRNIPEDEFEKSLGHCIECHGG